MKTAAILDGLGDNDAGELLKRILEENGFTSQRFQLQDMNIHPCHSCASCGEKTPGECVQKDDMESLYRTIGPCDMLVFMTPVTFGGYSSHLKKAVDRLMAIGYPLYKIKRGHMLHPMRYTGKSLFIIGRSENGCAEGEEDNFRLLASRNSLNFQYPYRVTLVHPGDDIEKTLREALAAPEKAVPY